MSISDRRAAFSARLLDFAWNEWSQLGVSAAMSGQSPWCQDPEALLLFTFEVARDDPRLFDEVLDWMVENDGLVSVRRLRALSVDGDDRRLTGAVVEWTSHVRRPTRSGSPVAEPNDDLEPLFRGGVQDVREPDVAFAAHGIGRTQLVRSGKSRAPDLHRPIGLALRLRQILGLGARAEVVRLLLTTGATTTAGVISGGAGYARRNVQEALAGLHQADVVSIVSAGGETRYAVDPGAWSTLLGLEVRALPTHRDWPQLLGAARTILRWLWRTDPDAMSGYLLSSSARDLIDEIRDDLAYAGIALAVPPSHTDALAVLDDAIEGIAAALTTDGPGAAATLRTVVAAGSDGTWRWELEGASGAAATSPASFATKELADRAATAFLRTSGRARTEVFDDGDGHGWRVRSPDGRVAAVSFARFATAAAAQRDADRRRPGAPSTLEVMPSPAGGWEIIGGGERQALAHHRTQQDAVRAAVDHLAARGLGEVVVHGRRGRVVARRTVMPRDR